MRVCLALFLVALSGCASRSTEAILEAARTAQDSGDSQTALRLIRDAAHRGDLGAAVELGYRGGDKHTLSDWLFNPRPTHAEARWWRARAYREAHQLVAAGDTSGHLTLGWMASSDGQPYGEMSPDSAAVARRHFDAAIALGSRLALHSRAILVWQTEGLLAAEPYFRESARAGSLRSAHLAALAISSRPRIEQGLSVRDVIGDLSKQDVVGSIRYLRGAGFPELAAQAEAQTEGLRIQARSGDAVADSIVRALDAPSPSTAAHPSATAAHPSATAAHS